MFNASQFKYLHPDCCLVKFQCLPEGHEMYQEDRLKVSHKWFYLWPMIHTVADYFLEMFCLSPKGHWKTFSLLLSLHPESFFFLCKQLYVTNKSFFSLQLYRRDEEQWQECSNTKRKAIV